VEKAFPHAKQKISFVSYIIIPPIPEMQVEKKDYFLYVGNLEKRKGTDLLLKAYDRYVANGGKRKLVIAGKICENDIGELLNEKAGKIDTLQYMGYMSGTEKDRLYRECGCFVFPSRAEGFGMPIVEALQCGKTVIASNLPIFKEVAPDGIAYFEISGGESAAIEKFAETMEAYDNNRIVKENKYENRYAPDSLSGPLYDFLNYSTEYR
jgi:glycosyltransferase involved in cell wall biosynthesis